MKTSYKILLANLAFFVLLASFIIYHWKPLIPDFVFPTHKENAQVIPKVDNSIENLENFFSAHRCLNYTLEYLDAANKYGIDYRLLPAISIQESGCGKHQLYNNLWGWDSNNGLKHFDTPEQGIDYISQKLSTLKYYKNKSVIGILKAYNKNPDYPGKVMQYVNEISPQP